MMEIGQNVYDPLQFNPALHVTQWLS